MTENVFTNDSLVIAWLTAFTHPLTPKTIKKLEARDKVKLIAEVSEMLNILAKDKVVKEALVEAASAYNKQFSLLDFAKGYSLADQLRVKMQQTIVILNMHCAALNTGCLTKEAIKSSFEYYIMAALVVFFWDQK